MFLVITLVTFIIGTIGWFMYHNSKCGSPEESIGSVLNYSGWILAAIGAFTALILLVFSMTMATADEKIEMYQEENAKIELQIAEVVKNYQEYETDIFTELSPESAMTMITLYPELKSDKLVESQIDVYVKNNDQIKSLKVQLIDRSIVNWWLYFGN